MSALALASFAIASNPDGTVMVGTATMPAHIAADLASRIWQAAGNAPEEVQGRIRCRIHLDTLFASAGKVRCWPTGSKQLGANLPAIYDGRRCCVRVSDTGIAVLLDHGTYHQGLAMQLRDDPLFGPVAEVARPMLRFSARGSQVLQIRVSE